MNAPARNGQLLSLGLAAALLVACAGGRSQPAASPADQTDFTRICVENDSDFDLTARIYGPGGSPLLRLNVRRMGTATDSLRRYSAGTAIYIGIDAVGIPVTHYPPAIQNVGLAGEELSFTIRGTDYTGFSASVVNPGECP